MFDANKIIVSKLKEVGLNVYDENFLDSKSTIPCISYREYDNRAEQEGDKMGYSTLVFYVKVWAKGKADIVKYSDLVDSKMRELGFKRTNINDLTHEGITQRAMKYQNMALENF